MKIKKIILLLTFITLIVSCSKEHQKTSAKLNLKLSGIVNLNSGVGSGGAILFGKSSTGEQFGKIISGTEVNLDLNNGDWSFYSVMWEKTSGHNFADVAVCGKSSNKLSGVAVSINLNLSNANCSDSEFSNGKNFSKDFPSVGLKNSFAKLFVEDCDDLSQSGSITCNLDNQGSALSYRLNFKSYTVSTNGALEFVDESLKSQCVTYSNVNASGMNVNFPTSNLAMPFIVSIEMYLGSSECSSSARPETKGMYNHVFAQGLETQGPNTKMIFNGGQRCSPKNYNIASVCEQSLGSISANICNIPETVSKFIPVEECTTPPPAPTATTSKNIKHIFSIPKNIFCYTDISNYGATDTDKFPAGDGSILRPFKICNEWQINQIGEKGSSPLMSTYHYKLLNDLDMNKTDFGALPKPLCTRVNDSIVGEHHNFNPLDGLFDNDCFDVKNTPSFTGGFNGNNKTISHARIQADNVRGLGFVRKLQSGNIKNLNFINLEVQGASEIGSIAGTVNAIANININNIKIDGLEIESKNRGSSLDGANLGAIAGIVAKNDYSVSIYRALVKDAEIYGAKNIGGLVGVNSASISESKFSGVLRVQGESIDSFTGGLVAINNAGLIQRSLSEGMIISNSNYIGGIIGKNFEGILDSAYSTIYFDAKLNPNSKVGGIIGYNNLGGYKNIYFDGVIANFTGTAYDVNPISNGDMSNLTMATGGCYFTDSNTNFPVNTCSKISRNNLVSGPGVFASGIWQLNSGASIPRFKWEADTNSRPCLLSGGSASVTVQKTTLNKGKSALEPIMICNPSQFSELSLLSSSDFANLGDNLNLSEFMNSQIISNFAGNFDGKNHGIYALNLNSSGISPDNIALFKNNSGTISNLKIVGNKIFNEASSSNFTAVLAAKNSGAIKNIKFVSNLISGDSYVGLVTGENKGLIDNIEIKDNRVKGNSFVGGISGSNSLNNNNISAIIRRVSVDAFIEGNSPTFDHLGGISGSNLGEIDQALFNGNIGTSYNNSPGQTLIGGITGLNQGVISNVLTSNRASISTFSTIFVGGLIGQNLGSITNSIALGRVLYAAYAPQSLTTFSATVGGATGSSANLYFLEKNIGSLIDVGTYVTTCSGPEKGFLTFATGPFYNQDSPDLYFNNFNMYGNNNNNLSTYSSITILDPFNMDYTGICNPGQNISFIKAHGPPGSPVAYFANPINFSALNMAYPGHLEENVLEYHKALMYKREPTMAIPKWVFEVGDSYPKLLQVRN